MYIPADGYYAWRAVLMATPYVIRFFMGSSWYLGFNSLQPNISMHILLAVIYVFPKVLTRRICVKSFLNC